MIQALLAAVGLDFLMLFAICTFWRVNVACAFFLAGIFVLVVAYWEAPFYRRILLRGGPFGVGVEWVCVRYRVWVYANPTWEGLPLWLLPVWAILMITFWQVALIADAILEDLPRTSRILERVGWVTLVLYCAFTLTKVSWAFQVGYGINLVLLALFGRSRRDLVAFWVGAAAGTFGEIVCMRYGVWHYPTAYFKSVGIPVSLPLAWGLSTFLIGLFARPLPESPDPQPAPAPA